MPALEILLPGDPETATGGYIYDRRIAAGLRDLGWNVRVHALDASFPRPDEQALAHADAVLAALPDDTLTLIDGLALGAMPLAAERHAPRLRLIGLVHHPLCAETGLSAAEYARLRSSEIRALAAMRHVVATSEETRAALCELGIARERVSAVEPGTDPAPPAPTASPRVRGEVSTAASAPRTRTAGVASQPTQIRLLCVATLTPRKGHSILLDALAPLIDLPWHLVCIGSLSRDRDTARAVLEQVAVMGLADRVSLVGEVDPARLVRELRLADLFVLPTLYEGYGMAVAEALRFGVPVIATRTGAIGRLLSRGGGEVVPPGDPKALSAALATVMANPRRLAVLREEARARSPEIRDWRDAAREMAAVLVRFGGG
jgi:glycosyltransferase involved in cell wall biosynthesis